MLMLIYCPTPSNFNNLQQDLLFKYKNLNGFLKDSWPHVYNTSPFLNSRALIQYIDLNQMQGLQSQYLSFFSNLSKSSKHRLPIE